MLIRVVCNHRYDNVQTQAREISTRLQLIKYGKFLTELNQGFGGVANTIKFVSSLCQGYRWRYIWCKTSVYRLRQWLAVTQAQMASLTRSFGQHNQVLGKPIAFPTLLQKTLHVKLWAHSILVDTLGELSIVSVQRLAGL